MLEIARVKAQGEEDPIEWQLGDIAAVPFNDSTVDIALCQQGLQWFPDRKAILKETGRVSKPGGRVSKSGARIVANVFADIEYCPGHVGYFMPSSGVPERKAPGFFSAALSPIIPV